MGNKATNGEASEGPCQNSIENLPSNEVLLAFAKESREVFYQRTFKAIEEMPRSFFVEAAEKMGYTYTGP